MQVESEETESERGLRAVNVRPLTRLPATQADGPCQDGSRTAAQISRLRERLLTVARSHGWVHD
ncbi:hypothetical protein [Streptomyces sp. NPDC001307]|uniref:hypothetical protein n=1 Tax=Streptomyces sp. NPDC001307 TaxID=3364560 RepID=UPI0036CB0AB0